MAKMRIRTNFKFADLLGDVVPGESAMRKAGEELAVKIENRAIAGLDENNKPFAPYSEAYAKSKGHRGTGTVDLHDTDRMFADFGVLKATKRGFSLGFRSNRSAQIAEYHESGAGNLPVRRFLGVPDAWVRDLVKRLIKRG